MRLLRTNTGRLAVAAIGAIAVTAVFMPSLYVHPDGRVLEGPSDVSSATRDYWSMERRGVTPFTTTRDPYLGAPEGTPFSPGVAVANAVQPVFVWAIKGATGILGALNVFMLLGLVLSAVLTFALLDRLGVHPLAAAFGAYAFAFNAYLIRKAVYGHAPLVHAWVFPALVLAMLRLRSVRTLWSAVVAGAVLAAAFYVHTYYGVIATVLALVLLGVELVPRHDRRTVALVAAGAAAAVVLVLPGALSLALDRGALGDTFGHRDEATEEFGARPLAYLVPPEGNPFLGGLVPDGVYDDLGPDGGEPELYLGWVAILLAVGGVVLLRRGHAALLAGERRYVAVAAVILVPVAFLCSLPSRMTVFGMEVPTLTALPSALTTYLRVYGRFGVLVALGIAILAALALDVLVRRRRGLALGAAAFALLAVELAYDLPIPAWDVSRAPAHVAFLAGQPPGIVASYPAQGDTAAENRYARQELFWQTRHGQPLFFTESAVKSRSWAIRLLADQPAGEKVGRLLAAERVRYVVVNDAVFRAAGADPPALEQGDFRLLGRAGGARVYELVAAPGEVDEIRAEGAGRIAAALGLQPAVTRIVGGFHGPEIGSDGREYRWMNQGGTIEVDNPDGDRDLELTTVAFSAAQPRRLALLDEEGRTLGETTVDVQGAVATIRPFRLPEGTSRIRLVASPGPARLGGTDTRVASVYLGPVLVQPYVDYSSNAR